MKPRIRITIDVIDENDDVIDGSECVAGAVDLDEFNMRDVLQWVTESFISIKMAIIFKRGLAKGVSDGSGES